MLPHGGMMACPRCSQVFIYFFPPHKGKQSFSKSTSRSWLGVGLGGEISSTVKLLFPSVIRVWSTRTRGRDPLQQLCLEVKFSIPPWGKQKSSSSSLTWKGWRQPHWKGSCWVLELRKNLCVYYSYWYDWGVFSMDLSGTQCYDT